MTALPATAERRTDNKLADIKKSIVIVHGRTTREVSDDLVYHIRDHLKKGMAKSSFMQALWQPPKPLEPTQPTFRSNFEVENRPRQKLPAWVFVFKGRQILILRVPSNAEPDDRNSVIVHYTSSNYHNTNESGGNNATVHLVWAPETPPNVLPKPHSTKSQQTSAFSVQKTSSPSSEIPSTLGTTRSDSNHVTRTDRVLDATSEPSAKRMKLNTIKGSRGSTRDSRDLGEQPMPRSTLPRDSVKRVGDRNIDLPYSVQCTGRAASRDVPRFSASADTLFARTPGPKMTTEAETGKQRPTHQNPKQDVDGIVDKQGVTQKQEHTLQPLSVPTKHSSSSEALHTGRGHNDIGVKIPPLPVAVQFYGQSRKIARPSAYENVKFLFYDIAGQRLGNEVPFHECNSASMLKDAALEHDSITDDTRMFVIRIGDTPETKMRVDIQTSFDWKIMEPLDEILKKGRVSKVVIHVSGMTTNK